MSGPRILLVFVALSVLLSSVVMADNRVLKAKCVIQKNSGVGPIEGTIRFSQPTEDDVNNRRTTMRINLSGFEKTSSETLHGFHVHASGGLGNKCNDAGGHYNPFNRTHGGQNDTERHVGDLGNIQVSDDGTVSTTITDRLISLAEPYSVLQRAIVVHALFDDLGRGGFNDSKTTGHAGARLGCCLIVKDTEEEQGTSGESSQTPSTLSSVTILLTVVISYVASTRD